MPHQFANHFRHHAAFYVFVLSAAALSYLAFSSIWPNVSPLSDDLSMIAFSRHWSADWFNKGLADYFIVYPEYYGAQSNFIRPVSNLIYWIFGALIRADDPFFANKVQLFILTYGMLLVCTASLYALLMRVQNDRAIGVLGALCGILIPTFWTTPTPTYTSFAFDGLSVAFCLLALIAFSRGRHFSMAILLILALLTKEIAFPVILGFATTFILTRNTRALFGPLAAILIWGLLRINGFGLHAEGVYVFGNDAISISALALEKLRNALSLPFGPVLVEEMITPSGIEIFNRSTALTLINLAVYGTVLIGVQRFAHHLTFRNFVGDIRSAPHREQASMIRIVAAFSALIAFAFDVYVGANYRYAFNFLPFLLISLAGLRLGLGAKRWLFMICVAGSAIASGPSIARLYTGMEFERARYQIIRDLFAELQQHQNSRSIVILNDIVLGYANPAAMEILVPTQTKIIRGTSLYLDSCKISDLSEIQTQITSQPDELSASVSLPECGRFTFESSPNLSKFAFGSTIRRNDSIHYEFAPKLNSSYATIKGWSGRDLKIVVRNADILYFDFKQSKWIFVARQD